MKCLLMLNPLRPLKDLKKIYVNGLPKVLFWAIINYCNVICTSCRFFRVPKSAWKYVPFEDAKKAIDILYDSDFRMISITGGEPLMNPDVFEICDYIHRKEMIITYIPTNGTLVNREVARRLRDADVRLVGISIDVEDERGMGVHRKIKNLREVAIHARECLEEAGVKTYAGVLLTKPTLDIPKVMRYVAQLGFDKLIFSYPQLWQFSSYMASNDIDSLRLTASEVRRAVEGIKWAKKNFPEIRIHNTNEALDDLMRFHKGVPRRYRCFGGKKLFYLDWNLDLYQCFNAARKYGNLLELGKVKIEEEDFCDLCSQQAFRDHGPMYHLASRLMKAKEQFLRGSPIKAIKLITDRDTRDAFGALHEFLTAEFV